MEHAGVASLQRARAYTRHRGLGTPGNTFMISKTKKVVSLRPPIFSNGDVSLAEAFPPFRIFRGESGIILRLSRLYACRWGTSEHGRRRPPWEQRLTMQKTSATSLRILGGLFDLGAASNISDGQLLEHFATGPAATGETAFAAILERHGPMVFGVCRAILRDEHAAMDAFQATFLVLIRKSRSLWVRESLGPWLHRVACRAAGRVRRESARHHRLALRVAERTAAQAVESPACPSHRDDLALVLHEEVDRLPERFRDHPLVRPRGTHVRGCRSALGMSGRYGRQPVGPRTPTFCARLERRGIGIVAKRLPRPCRARPSARACRRPYAS